jgi:hypothetical protein
MRAASDRCPACVGLLSEINRFHCPLSPKCAVCAEQFHDGYYFGCIALTRTVLEGIRHVWQIKFKKNPKPGGSLRQEPRSAAQKEDHQRQMEG